MDCGSYLAINRGCVKEHVKDGIVRKMPQLRNRRQCDWLEAFVNARVVAVKGGVPGHRQQLDTSDSALLNSRREMCSKHLVGKSAKIVYYFDYRSETQITHLFTFINN